MRHSFELFTDYFACRDTPLGRLDARVKLAVATACLAAILASTQPRLPLVAFALGVCALLAARIPPPLVGLRLLPPLGMVIVLLLLQGLLVGTTPLFTLALAGWDLTLMQEGVRQGALIGSRVAGAAGTLLLLSFTTPAHEIFRALRWCRVPQTWVEIALLMYRSIFLLLDETAEMVTAQRVRLGYAGLRNSLSSLGSLTGSLIVRSVEQGLRTHEAMIARGYVDTLPFSPLPPLRNGERLGLLATLLVIAAAYLALEGGSR